MVFVKILQYAAKSLLFGAYIGSALAGCPDCQDERCLPFGGACACFPRIGCVVPITIPGTTNPGSPLPSTPVPLPPPLQKEVDKTVEGATHTVEDLGNATLTTLKKAGGDTVSTLQKAGGDTITTFQKAGDDSLRTVTKAAGDATATYIKAWRDTGEQTVRSFKDATDAGNAALRFTKNQLDGQRNAFASAERRLRDGKIVDAMWGLGTEPLQSSEKNFAQATQESEVINTAAASAAAVYGGPGGAAAYASWATYRRTGDADLAFRAGILAAATAQMGSSVAKMPAGTTGEIIKKAAVAGAAGGISVAAAGGDEQAIKEGFLKSAGAVLIQGGSNKLKEYSPNTKDALDTVQCISARDVDCLSNTTWARDAKGKILYDKNGKPRIDVSKYDPKTYIAKWTGIDPNSLEGKKNAFVTKVSKLPGADSIPLLNNRWVLTWTLGKDQNLERNKPTVVLTYVGNNPPFISKVEYGREESARTKPVGLSASNKTFICPSNGYKRTVNVSMRPNSCDSVYRKEGGVSQRIWHSDHQSEICAIKTLEFIRQLRSLGIVCSG